MGSLLAILGTLFDVDLAQFWQAIISRLKTLRHFLSSQ